LAVWPSPDACVDQSDLPIVGKWNGYVGRFQNLVADFQVDIRGASAAGGLCGTITFKPGTTPPPPPVDFEKGYPIEPMYTFPVFGPPLIDGFVFTLVEGRAQGTRVAFGVAMKQPWQTWCEHQPSYLWQPDGSDYNCLPNWGGGGTDGQRVNETDCFLSSGGTNQDVTINCGRWMLCATEHVCVCNPARCVANQQSSQQWELDFAGDEATGTVTGYGSPVLLARVP
jgi:hypothetical protein